MNAPPPRFPDDFAFGVATAAYQVEGNIENDWSEWERGRFDDAVLDGYRRRLLAMTDVGLRPVVTLHHFTHPAWFHRETPWHLPESVGAFRRYARACAEVLRGIDAVVLTFNEPMVLLLGGYVQGVIPPGIADPRLAMPALGNVGRAHAAAREELLTHAGRIPVGTSQNMLSFTADRAWNPMDHALVRLADDAYNHAFLEAMVTGELRMFMPGLFTTRQKLEGARDSLDFVGVNYYTRAHLRFTRRAPYLQFNYRDPLHRGLTDIGWEFYPEGFAQILLSTRRYGLPVWVTENGIDDRVGTRRSEFLWRHWAAVLQARAAGIDVRGYLYWSLLDNFE